jgi:hypothetical protein
MADKNIPITGKLAIDGKEGVVSFDVPNWSREQSLVALNKKVQTMSNKFGKSGTVGLLLKEVAGGIADVEKAVLGTKKQQKKDNTADNKSQKETAQHQNQTQQASDALLGATLGNQQALKDLADLSKKNGGGGDEGGILGSLSSKAGPFAVFGNTLMRAAKGIAGFVVSLGKAAAALATLITATLMKTFNYLNDSLTNGTAGLVGAYTDGSTNIATQASYAGLSMKAFTEALTETSEEIMVLGAEGYKDLRNATRDVSGGLFDMGFRNEEITKLLGREISIRARMGMRLNMEGTNLAGNVVEVGRSLRHVSKAAGINAETLYNSSKVSDETNTLIAARARELGDDGISELQTSIRKLSMKMVGLSPTYAHEITSPLINAIITGAVGLDDGFSELVVAMPSLTDAMNLAQQDITNSGKITDSTINEIMTSLVDTTEEDFERAKQLALMTRSQSAIQAVNFASEVRARQALIGDLTRDGDTARNISVISAQADTFFDMMKAPFENAITQFTMGILGVSSTGEGANFGTLITNFSYLVEDFLVSTGLFKDLFVGSGFFARFNKQIEAYFSAGTGEERAKAAEALQNMFIKAIDDMSASIGDAAKQGVLGQMITNMFRNLMDQIVLAVYEGSDGRFFKESAGEAYIRAGRFNEARAMNDKGLVFGGTEGQGAHHGVVGLFDQYMNNEAAMADKFGITTLDFQQAGNPMLNNKTDPKKRIKLITDLQKKYPHMTDKDIEVLFKAAGEMRGEMTEMMRQYDLLSTVTYKGRDYEQINIDDLAQRFKDGDRKLDQFLQYYAQNKNIVNSGLQSSTFADFNPASNRTVGGVAMLPEAIEQLDYTIDTVRHNLGSNGITAGTVFKSVVTELIKSGSINVNDGINDREKAIVSNAVQEAYITATGGNRQDSETQKDIRMLIAAMHRLTYEIKGKEDNPTT